jgi:hypothetical protein
MANTASYPIIAPKAGDLIVGTQTFTAADPVTDNPTRNFTVASVLGLVGPKGAAETVPVFKSTGFGDSKITQVVFDASTTAVNVGTIPTKGGGVAGDPFYIDSFQVEGTLSVSEKVAIGTPRQLENQGFDLNILGQQGKIAFGDNNIFGVGAANKTWNVVVGEYGSTDTDQLQLHGKVGTLFTRGALGDTVSCKIDTAGNFEVVGANDGYILASPNGTRHLIRVTNAGALTVTAL